MKSTNKVTIQVEDYKGNITEITGFKSLRVNVYGNLVGYVGRTKVENFSRGRAAAEWLLDTIDTDITDAFLEKHIITA